MANNQDTYKQPFLVGKNTTQGTTVAQHVMVADNPWTRFMGLMGKSELPSDVGLWIVPCKDIHSFWMRFEFDAIFLDKDGVVLHLVERMRPNRISKIIGKAHGVLELNGGVIAESGTQLGDVISFSESEV